MNAYDLAYWTALAVGSPYWMLKSSARQKVSRAFAQRGGDWPQRDPARPGIFIHAVSLGEINATRGLVRRLGQLRPDAQFIVSTTTEAGWARGQELYGTDPAVLLVRYPLDFSGAVRRCLDSLRPDVVALMELEVWPNFLLQCNRREIPVVLINGRLTPSSYRNYRMGGPLVRSMFQRLSAVCAQDELYAKWFASLGIDPQNLSVTGTMKFDTATIANRVEGDADLAGALGLWPGQDLIWVCGSTGPGEEELILREYRRLLARWARLRLVLVPRKPERFDEVADLIRQAGFDVVRRSEHPARNGQAPASSTIVPPVILGDTMGELRKFYSLADVVFVGRTLVDLGSRQRGSDMIEAAALARPVIVGPYTHNFAEPMRRLEEAQGVLVAGDAEQLGQAVSVLLSSPERAGEMAGHAQQVVRDQQGATERHAQVILEQLRLHSEKSWPTVVTRD